MLLLSGKTIRQKNQNCLGDLCGSHSTSLLLLSRLLITKADESKQGLCMGGWIYLFIFLTYKMAFDQPSLWACLFYSKNVFFRKYCPLGTWIDICSFSPQYIFHVGGVCMQLLWNASSVAYAFASLWHWLE